MSTDTPTPGDGVITIVIEGEEDMPPVDLPENIAAQLQLESVGNIQSNNQSGRAVSTVAMGVLQSAAARNFDELGAVEGRATSGINATPIAGPSTP